MNKASAAFLFQIMAILIMIPIISIPDWVLLVALASMLWYPVFSWISFHADQNARLEMDDFYLQDGEQVVSEKALKRSRDRYRKALKREMTKAREVLKDAN